MRQITGRKIINSAWFSEDVVVMIEIQKRLVIIFLNSRKFLK